MERWLSPAGRQGLKAPVLKTALKKSMFFVYFLKSGKDNGLYIGKTNDVARRLSEHNSGNVSSTKSRRPFVLLGYEACVTEIESTELEKEWKKGYKREELKKKYNLI